MGARLQQWVNRNIWDFSSSHDGGLTTVNGSLLQSILDLDNFSEEPISIRKALRISTVYTCINVICKTMASLPVNVISEENNKKKILTDHSAYYPLAHEPNEYMSSANFTFTLTLHFLAWGNAYAYIHRDSRNKPIGFDIWEPWEVSINREQGELYYTYKGQTENASDVLHYRGYSLDGICGLSPILENANTMGMAIKLDRYSALITGARPPGILSYEGNLNPVQVEQNQKNFTTGTDKVKVLSGRWHYDPIMTQPEASQFVQTKNLNQREIYGIWQIPPPFAQNFERATYSNAEQSDLAYAKHTITPICRIYEQENNMKLFFEREKKTTYTKYNMNGLLRGDIAARQAFYQAMVNTGIMNRNEARGYEDLNPYEGGDEFLIQGAMIPADMDLLRKKMETEVIPTAPKLKQQLNGQHVN